MSKARWIKLLGGAALVVVVAAVGFGLRQSKKTSQPGSGKETFGGDGNWEKLQIPQRQAAFFSLEPVMASKYGVPPRGEFILKTQAPVSAEFVKNNLKTTFASTVATVSNTQYRVVPQNQLRTGQTVKIALAVGGLTEGGQTFDRDYGWAYQTQGKFRVTSIIPAGNAVGVPVITGIEMVFSQDDFTDPTPFFSIEPTVQFRTERHGETWVVVPLSPLTYKTVYTVTLKKGVNLSSRDDPVADDLVFTFQTQEEQKPQETPRLGMADSLVEVTPKDLPTVKVFTSSWKSDQTVGAEIYQYRTGEDFVKAVSEANMAQRTWYRYFAEDKPADTGKLIPRGKADVKPGSNEYLQFLQLPETLPEGFYLVQWWYNNHSKLEQTWIQSTNIAGYVSVGREQTLVWVNDLAVGAPVNGAGVKIVGESGGYYTSADGIVVFATGKELFGEGTHFAQISVEGAEKLYLPISSLGGNAKPGEQTVEDFWSYLYHERHLYKPTDTVNFWGVVKNRDTGQAPDSLKISLVTRNGDEKTEILSRTTGLASDGTFAGSITMTDLPAGWYTLEAKAGETVVTSAGLEVREFTKPEMKIDVSSDKKVLFAGEKMEFTAQVSFFDTTPARNIDLNVHEDQGGKVSKIASDPKGEIKYQYQPQYSGNSADYPRYESITVNPALAQETTVEGYGSVYVFGAKILLATESTQVGATAKMKARVNRVDLAKFDSGQPNEVKGAAAVNKEVTIFVKKTWWERVENGTYYDFIEKVTRPAFNYVRHEELQPDVKLLTNNLGEADFEFGMEKNRGYEVTVKVADDEGRSVVRREYFYYYEGGTYDYSQGEKKIPELKLTKTENSYSLGEEVNAAVELNGKPYPGNNKFLFITAGRGRQDFYIQNEPQLTFTFSTKYLPNAYIGAVIFTGKDYRTVAAGCDWGWYCMYEGNKSWFGLEIRYKKEDSRLTVEAKPGKEKYKPGDKAEVTVKVSKAGLPAAGAEVNMTAVDQALAAIGGVVTPEILGGVYRPIPSLMYYAYYSHKPALPDGGGAEKGGGGGDYREIFKDTAFFGRTKTDSDGVAVFTFTVPDNLTTWLVYTQAVTADLSAGQTESRVIASQDFFVTSQFPATYLEKDRPVLAANSFGTGLEANAVTAYTASFTQGLIEKSKLSGSGKAGKEVGFDFPQLGAGEYKAGVAGKSGDKEDGVLLPFKVLGSRWSLDYATNYRVEAGKTLSQWNLAEAVKNKPITIVVSDAGKGRYYYQLKNYCWTYSNRVEKAISRARADQILTDKFNDESCPAGEKKLAQWQAADGGLGQVWWGGSNLETTVWGLAVDSGSFDAPAQEKMAQYFENKVKENNSGTIQKILGYWGLGLLEKPTLGNLQQLAGNTVSFEEKADSALALAYIGDTTKARGMYFDLLADYGYSLRPYYRIQRDGEKMADINKMVEDTAQMLLLGSLVEKYYNDGLGAYVRDFKGQADDVVLDLAQMAFVNEELAKLPAQDTGITVDNAGNRQSFTLDRGNSRVIDVMPQNINRFSLTVNKGRAEVTANYTLGADGAGRIPKDNRLSIKRSWRKAKGSGDKIVPGDVVEITIDADVNADGPQGEYNITDYLPAGLVYLDNPGNYGLQQNGWTWQVENNVIKAYFYNSPWWKTYKKSIVYYARAAMAGTYTAEPAVLQSILDRAVIQTTNEETIKINLN